MVLSPSLQSLGDWEGVWEASGIFNLSDFVLVHVVQPQALHSPHRMALTSHKDIAADRCGALDFGINVLVIAAVVTRVIGLALRQHQHFAVGLRARPLAVLFPDCPASTGRC